MTQEIAGSALCLFFAKARTAKVTGKWTPAPWRERFVYFLLFCSRIREKTLRFRLNAGNYQYETEIRSWIIACSNCPTVNVDQMAIQSIQQNKCECDFHANLS